MVRNIFIVVFAFIALNSCKKDLVDASKNEISDVTSADALKAEIKEGTSVVFFYAVWCSVCEEFRPTIEAVSTNSELSNAAFIEVEYDTSRDIFKEFGVSSFPQLLIFKDGVEQTKLVGKNHSEKEVVDAIKQFL